MDFLINDKVIFINENLRGKIIKIKDDILIIECNKVEIEANKHDVIRVNDNYNKIYSKFKTKNVLDEPVNDFISENKIQDFNNELKINFSKNFELDLHIEEIIENFSCLSSQEILQIQMNTFFKGIFKAKRMGLDYLIVIHGKGKGILRKKIVDFLEENEANYSPANYLLYKGGGIEIKIN